MDTIERTDLAEKLDAHVKTYKTRQPNWRVFGFETQVDPKYARAQRRYLGLSGNVTHSDPTAMVGAHFTLSIMQQPPGHLQPLHHHDEEEVFFVLVGNPTIIWEFAGKIVERQLEPWDMVYNPPGQVHGIRNDGTEDAYFQVMLGNPTPDRPKYMDPELRKLQKVDNPDKEARQS